MSYFTDFTPVRSGNSNSMGRNSVILMKKGNFLSLGLPLGSGMVLIALLNTIFAAHSILNFIEIISIMGGFTVKSHLLPSLMVGFLLILTSYLWIAVIFTGRSYHVSIWIAGSLLLLLLKVVISSWTLLLSLTLKDALYWRKLCVLGVDIGMEIYIISLAVLAANVLWRKDDGLDTNLDLEGQPQYQRYLTGGGGDGEVDLDLDGDLDLRLSPGFLESSSLPLPPMGLGPRALFQFYTFPQNIELGARVLVILDIIYSVYILTTEKIPEVLLASRNPNAPDEDIFYDDITEVGTFSNSRFGDNRIYLIFMEDMIIRLGRVVLGWITVSYLMNHRTSSQKLGHALLAQLSLITFSMFIYFMLFGFFEQLSSSDRFYQTKFTLDILLRLGLVGFLTKAVERRRLVQGGRGGGGVNVFS